MIEKMKKVISSHRAALDFDKGYLNKVVTPDGYDFVAEVKSEKISLIKIEGRSGGARRERQTTLDLSLKKKQRCDGNN